MKRFTERDLVDWNYDFEYFYNNVYHLLWVHVASFVN